MKLAAVQGLHFGAQLILGLSDEALKPAPHAAHKLVLWRAARKGLACTSGSGSSARGTVLCKLASATASVLRSPAPAPVVGVHICLQQRLRRAVQALLLLDHLQVKGINQGWLVPVSSRLSGKTRAQLLVHGLSCEHAARWAPAKPQPVGRCIRIRL